MTASRLLGRRGDGSAAVRGWVAMYTLGLPASVRSRRRDEVTGDLADETIHAIRRGDVGALRRQRLVRLLLGIPADLEWRLVDAPAMARDARVVREWVPVSRWSLALLAIVAIGAAGTLALVVGSLVGERSADSWMGWGPYGVVVASLLVLVAVLAAVPWPRRGVAIVAPAVVLGMAAAPWLWGCWFLALVAVIVRWYQASEAGDSVRW